MADERDAWLDKDAAERLLRGDPVTAPNEHDRAREELLSGVLRDMSDVTYANGAELPGEAAALAAFRQAKAAGRGTERTRATDRAGRAQRAGSTEDADMVHLPGIVGSALTAGSARLRRSGRPLRTGIAMAVAGCALGGATVVAAAGVLPSLLGGGQLPGPASSVSVDATPKPLLSGLPDASGSPSTGSTGDRSAEVPEPSSGELGDGAGEDAGKDRSGDSDDVPIGPVGDHRDQFSPDGETKSGKWYHQTVDACRDYLSGSIEPERREELETATDGSEGAERYCDRLLDSDPHGDSAGSKDEDGGKNERGNNGDSGGNNGGGGNNNGGGNNDGGNNDDGNNDDGGSKDRDGGGDEDSRRARSGDGGHDGGGQDGNAAAESGTDKGEGGTDKGESGTSPDESQSAPPSPDETPDPEPGSMAPATPPPASQSQDSSELGYAPASASAEPAVSDR
jgi:hypothetical protein